MHSEGRTFTTLLEVIIHRHDAPDTASQELLKVIDEATGDLGIFDTQVHE